MTRKTYPRMVVCPMTGIVAKVGSHAEHRAFKLPSLICAMAGAVIATVGFLYCIWQLMWLVLP